MGYAMGSSPRGRGAPWPAKDTSAGSGLIPAWAGSTLRRWTPRRWRGAHPRVGGEHTTPPAVWRGVLGSSPRGRGAPAPRVMVLPLLGLIPAWAGSTVCPRQLDETVGAHPRVGGEHTC